MLYWSMNKNECALFADLVWSIKFIWRAAQARIHALARLEPLILHSAAVGLVPVVYVIAHVSFRSRKIKHIDVVLDSQSGTSSRWTRERRLFAVDVLLIAAHWGVEHLRCFDEWLLEAFVPAITIAGPGILVWVVERMRAYFSWFFVILIAVILRFKLWVFLIDYYLGTGQWVRWVECYRGSFDSVLVLRWLLLCSCHRVLTTLIVQ